MKKDNSSFSACEGGRQSTQKTLYSELSKFSGKDVFFVYNFNFPFLQYLHTQASPWHDN